MSTHKTFVPETACLMVDIETLSTTNMLAPIVAIAAVSFNMSTNNVHIESTRKWYVEPHPEAVINYQTVRWWMHQPREAQQAAFDLSEKEPLHKLEDALAELVEFYKLYSCEVIWCKGVQFDIGNIEFYLKRYAIEIPWKYNEKMDVRPYSRLLSAEQADGICANYNLHDPVDDCKCQIEMVQTVFDTYVHWTIRH